MSLNIKTTTNVNEVAEFITNSILKQLELNKKVLWFVTGGSSITVAVEAAKLIASHQHQNLTVMMTDERYGLVGHPDSNWQQLLEKGFNLPQARLIPILTGDSREVTTKKFNTILEKELTSADFRIGLFGVGADDHTAGILPKSEAVDAQGLAFGYNSSPHERITVTFKGIVRLDEIVAFVQGEEKWKAIENLEKDLDVRDQPAQILKRVPLLTVFTNYRVAF